jgi:hypothetical protein
MVLKIVKSFQNLNQDGNNEPHEVGKIAVVQWIAKTFPTWWERFIAYASVGKFLEALKNGGENAMPSTETAAIDSIDAGKETAAAKQRNALAMAILTMAFELKVYWE